ncbi:MAG TPA: thermonuclease family protein [Nostocaceae cyanobacterium]|nr:thermonuclease family protein [Nostocaceae cyanobacterium]
MKYTRFLSISIFAVLVGTSDALAESQLAGKILSVGDGDTVTAQFGTKKSTIRLACIDAPEIKQAPWGQKSRDRLKQLLPVGQPAKFSIKEKDRYGRFVAEVFSNGKNINLVMVQEGQAVVYREYLKNCPDSKNDLLSGEATAKSKKLNFWSQSNPVMPWDFRRGSKPKPKPTNTPTPQAKNCDPSYPDVCIPPAPPDLDCPEIPYKNFRVVGNDPHGFDRDNDGVGCER